MILSIVIPCYNEEKNIPLILERFATVVGIANDIEVILVNNGSVDNSMNLLNELAPKYSFVKVVNVIHNQGYGYGILQGLKAANGDYLGWTHADMQTDPSDVVHAFEIIKQRGNKKNLFVKGQRKNRQFFDKIFSVGMGIFESIYLGAILFEINAQPTVFHRNLYDKFINAPHDFSLDLYALYMAKIHEQEVIRFDVLFPNRIHGMSSWNTSWKNKYKFIKRTMEFSIKLKKSFKKKDLL